jgi:nitrogen fixation protein FixH
MHMTAMGVVLYIAHRDPSFSVEPEHYKKSLAWDITSARQQASLALGWTVTLASDVEVSTNGTRKLTCQIQNREGQPVHGAQVTVLAFAHARADRRLQTWLTEQEAGMYVGHPAMMRPGLWEFRIEMRQGAIEFSTIVMHTVKDGL